MNHSFLERCKFDCLLSDYTPNNMMFDLSGMYPMGFHPVKIDRNRNFRGRATASAYTRTERLPRYFLIDFGLSRQYTTREVVDEPLRGGDKSAPGHQQLGRLCNPFHIDIYYIGNLVRIEFMEVRDQIRGSRIFPYFTLEIPRLQVHGGFGDFGQRNDGCHSSESSSYRRGRQAFHFYPRVVKQHQATLRDTLRLEKIAQNSSRRCTGKTARSHGSVHPRMFPCSLCVHVDDLTPSRSLSASSLYVVLLYVQTRPQHDVMLSHTCHS
jgi:hypothetical protein